MQCSKAHPDLHQKFKFCGAGLLVLSFSGRNSLVPISLLSHSLLSFFFFLGFTYVVLALLNPRAALRLVCLVFC